MKSFPLTSPPEGPGIYALANHHTGQIYIGQALNLRRRYGEWKGAIVSGLGHKNKTILAAVAAGHPEHWSFGVLLDLPGADRKTLDKQERRAICRVLKTKPGLVLNAIVPQPEDRLPLGVADTKKSSLQDDAGNELTHGEAARLLRVTKQAVKKRLRAYRDRGTYVVRISDWGKH